MDKRNYEQAIAIAKRSRLDQSLKDVMSVAEDAWAANKLAYRLIDLDNDEVKGEDKLIQLEIALDEWITELEILAHASEKVAKRANKALHSTGYYDGLEEDGEGLSDDEAGDEADEGQAESEGTDRGGSGG